MAKKKKKDTFWDHSYEMAKKYEDEEEKKWGQYVRLYKDGAYGQGKNELSLNITYSLVSQVLSLLYAQDPIILCTADEEAASSNEAFAMLAQMGIVQSPDQAADEFANTLQKLLRYSYKEARSNVQNNAILFESIVRGMGISKESYDPVKGIDRVDSIQRHELYIDPHARFDLAQAGYVTHTVEKGIDEAREFFAARGVPEKKIQPNYHYGDNDSHRDQQMEDAEPEEMNRFRFHETWWKDGNVRRLMYRDYKTDNWIISPGEMEWPFVLDHDEFPFTILSFNRQFNVMKDAFPSLFAADGIRKLLEETTNYMNKHIKRSRAKKLLIDKERLTPSQIAQIKNPRDMEVILLEGSDGRPMRDVTEVLDLNRGDDESPQIIEWAEQTYDKITGIDEITRGGQSKTMSATEANVRDESSKLRSQKMQKEFDIFLDDQLRHRVQIARQLVDPGKVRKVSGQLGELLWQVYAGNGEDIISEYSVNVQQGSTGQRAKQVRIENKMMLLQQAKEVNQLYGMPHFNLEAIILDLLEEQGERRPERYLNTEMAQYTNSGQAMADAQAAEMPPEEPMPEEAL